MPAQKESHQLTRGLVIKVVSSFGSQWGRIRPQGGSSEIFFNASSFDDPAGFSSIKVGQAVEFVERADHVNGTHAEHVLPAAALPAGTAGD